MFFTLARDEFDFFSQRAYGVTAGADQNFKDFELNPHNWLRLTVTPLIEQEKVDVAFEVITLDGRRLALARSPASYVAGEQFRENVFRMVDNMVAQENEMPGSSAAWQVPFHYDDPEGGGVVRVIAQGQGGVFRIAYAVESPVARLRDVDFVPYQGNVDLSAPPEVTTSCSDVGSEPADSGRFLVSFAASPTVVNSANLTDPLRGPVWMSVYRAEDVTISGPKDGAESVGSFHFDLVDITDPAQVQEYPLDFTMPAGEYQILGFMDIDGNADPEDAGPDTADPVTLPIGGYTLECAEQPIVIEFALLLPEGR